MKKFILILILLFFAFLVPSREIAFAEGGIAWDPSGKPVCTASNSQQNIRMVPDGSGGAIIVWEDYRNSITALDIYAQKIDENGQRKWAQDGVIVSTAPNSQIRPVVVGDGYGGAIIAWEDYSSGIPNIYAVRISSAGMTYPAGIWMDNGEALSPGPYNQSLPDIVSDGYDGAIIVWQEFNGSQYSIYAHGIDGYGNDMWFPASVVVSGGMERKECPKIINDGTGYVIVTWQDFRNTNWDIYVQKLNITDGMTHIDWEVNGSSVTVAALDQLNPQIASAGSGGAVIAWTDNRNSSTTGPDIYAQWISSTAVRVWGTGTGDLNGITICQAENEQNNPVIVSRLSAGTTVGAIFSWEDKRVDPNGDIYAMGIDLDIGPGWNGEDMPIATGYATQMCPRLVNDSQGGGIGAWIEKDPPGKDKIFATKRGEYGVPLWNSYPGVLVYQGSNIKNHQIVNDNAGGIIVAWQAIGASGNYDIFAQRVVDAPFKYSASVSGRVTLSDGETGITGVEVWALRGEELVSSAISDTNGYYRIIGLAPEIKYLVRANWSANGIESSVCQEAFAPSYSFDFTLELDYDLGTIAGNVSGVEREAKRVSAAGFENSLSPGNGTAFVELEQRGKVIVRVPLETEGSYIIPNLLPGRFIARAYNGNIYSNPRIVNLSEGETLRVDFAFGIMPEETVFNYPNPAKDGSTTIRYYCGYSDPEAEIKIYNISGELVRKVEDNDIDTTAAPIYSFLWDCKNNSGKEIASGIYIYAVEVKEKGGNGSKKVMKRMAVIR